MASVVAQTTAAWELVIVDDGSLDETRTLLASWEARDPRIRVHRRDVPGGITRALQDGMSLTRADLVARLDADDRAAPDRLHLQIEELTRRPALGLLGTGARYVDERGREVLVEEARSGPDVARHLRQGNVFFHPSVVFTKAAYDAAGGYRRQTEPAEDYDLWLRMAEHVEVDNIPAALIDYRLHSAQSGVVRVGQQADAMSAAAWAAGVRARGGQDPLVALEAVDADVLVGIGLPPLDLHRRRADHLRWSADVYGRAGLGSFAARCWDAALAEAAFAGRDATAAVLRGRASSSWADRHLLACARDLVRAGRTAPSSLAAAVARRLRPGR